MAIQKKVKPNVSSQNIDAFLEGAPDANKLVNSHVYDKGIAKGNKRQISITIAPELLRLVDERAEHMGIGRSSFISMALFRILNE